MADQIVKNVDMGLVIEPTWHRKPEYKLVETIDVQGVEEIMNLKYLRKEMEFTHEGETYPIGGKIAIVNSRTMQEVGVHGRGYGENQPQEIFPGIAEVLIDHDFEIVSTGTLKGGAKLFISAKLPDEFSFDLGGVQVVERILNIGDGVDGTCTFRIGQAARRIQCGNTFSLHLLGVPPIIRCKHTKGGQAEVKDVARALDAALTEQKGINEAVERLIETTFTERQFLDIVRNENVLGKRPEEEGNGRTTWDRRFDEIVKSYNDPNLDGIRETKLGAIMAVQFVEQHVSTVRGSDRESRHLDNLVFGSQKNSEKAAALIRAS